MSMLINPYYTVPALLENVGHVRCATIEDLVIHSSKISAIRNFLTDPENKHIEGIALPQLGVKINAAVVRRSALPFVEIWINANYEAIDKANRWETVEDCICCSTERKFIRSEAILFTCTKFYFTNKNTFKENETVSIHLNYSIAGTPTRFKLFKLQHLIDHMRGNILSNSIENSQELSTPQELTRTFPSDKRGDIL